MVAAGAVTEQAAAMAAAVTELAAAATEVEETVAEATAVVETAEVATAAVETVAVAAVVVGGEVGTAVTVTAAGGCTEGKRQSRSRRLTASGATELRWSRRRSSWSARSHYRSRTGRKQRPRLRRCLRARQWH